MAAPTLSPPKPELSSPSLEAPGPDAQDPEPQQHGFPRRVLPAAALAATFLAATLYLTPVPYGPEALAYLFVLYLCLAGALHFVAALGHRLGRVLGLTAGLPAGLAVASQWRWDGELLAGLASFGLVVVAVMGALYLLERVAAAARPSGVPWWHGLLGLVATGALTAGVFGAGFFGTETLRWHLLNHNRLLGRPAYALLCSTIPVVRTELWTDPSNTRVEPWQRAVQLQPRAPVMGAGAPNVVLILVDTLRADAWAALGGPEDAMPRTNARIERSVLLSNVQANASWTRASVASLFTGLIPEEHGAVRFHDQLSESWPTLADLLQNEGWQTAAFVTNWVQVGVQTGFAQGFDHFVELSPNESRDARASYARAEETNAQVLNWVDQRASDQPLFLYVHYLDPHSPYLAGDEPGAGPELRERKLGAYRQELRYLDEHLDELFVELEAQLEGPTVFVVTSDHGEEFWEHGRWGHGHALYRELVWVPTFCYVSGSKSGQRVDAPLETRDLYDLVLQVARPGEPDVAGWAAESAREVRYASQYLDRTGDIRDERKHTAMRRIEEDGMELIWSAYGPTSEVYDLTADPGELHNVADQRGDALVALRAALGAAVRWWTQPEKVTRSEAEQGFLEALGYAGGASEEATQ